MKNNNHTVRKGLKLRCKRQEGISCQTEVRGTQPKSGAAHRATVTVTLQGRDHCPRQCVQSQRLQTGGDLDSQPGWGTWTSVTTSVTLPDSSSQDQVPLYLWGFFPSIHGFYYSHNAIWHWCWIAWLPAEPKCEPSVHVCTPSSEWRSVTWKAKPSASRIKVKPGTGHCNKSGLMFILNSFQMKRSITTTHLTVLIYI